jgi:hypothetical protein
MLKCLFINKKRRPKSFTKVSKTAEFAQNSKKHLLLTEVSQQEAPTSQQTNPSAIARTGKKKAKRGRGTH